jgi:hypothetical protein
MMLRKIFVSMGTPSSSARAGKELASKAAAHKAVLMLSIVFGRVGRSVMRN